MLLSSRSSNIAVSVTTFVILIYFLSPVLIGWGCRIFDTDFDDESFLRAPEELDQGNPFDPSNVNSTQPIALAAKLQAQKQESKKFDIR